MKYQEGLDRERDKVEKVEKAFVIIHKTESTFGLDERKVFSSKEKASSEVGKDSAKRRQLKGCSTGERLGDVGRDNEGEQLDS